MNRPWGLVWAAAFALVQVGWCQEGGTASGDEPGKEKAVLLFLSYEGDRVSLKSSERRDAFLPRGRQLPQAAEQFLEITGPGGEVLHAVGLMDPRVLMSDFVNPETKAVEGSTVILDQAILPVVVPDLKDAKSIRVKRWNRPRSTRQETTESGAGAPETILESPFPGGGDN